MCENLVDDDLDRMRSNIDGPLQLRDGVVDNTPSEMAMGLKCETANIA